MGTQHRAAQPVAGLQLVPALLGLVRFQHTVFALPFAFAGALLAKMAVPAAERLFWILIAMIGARSLAMALNRLIDAPIDALNPRTAEREIPAGKLTSRQVIVFCVVSLVVLLVAVSQLPKITWVLWPIPVAAFVIYPYTKRFTWTCHLFLGFTIGLAPVGGWIAVTGSLDWGGVLLGLAVATWIAGFDVIYALLDIDFDRGNRVHSIPARFGPDRALTISRGLHTLTVALLVAAGLASGAGTLYLIGVGVVAAILMYEHMIAKPDDQASLQAAFGSANMLVSVVFFAAVVVEVTLS